jgi:hypothetical protein
LVNASELQLDWIAGAGGEILQQEIEPAFGGLEDFLPDGYDFRAEADDLSFPRDAVSQPFFVLSERTGSFIFPPQGRSTSF